MFRTLKMKDRDIVFDSLGKLSWIEDETSIAQTVNIKLSTALGQLFYDTQIGLDREEIKNTLRNIDALTPEIQRALIDEDKIIDAQIVDVIIPSIGVAIIKIAVTLFDLSQVEVNFDFDINVELEVGDEENGI